MKLALTYNVKEEGTAENVFGGVGLPEDILAEWDDMDTILSVMKALESKHGEGNVHLIEANKDAYGKLRELNPDLVFNIAEGLHGESRESQMPCVFELLGLPYTGSNPLTLALCLNKARAKEILTFHGIANAGFWLVNSVSEVDDVLKKIDTASVGYPLMVKPIFEGSSKGVRDDSIVNSKSELEEKIKFVLNTYKQPVIVEEFLSGREFTVAMLGNGHTLRVLPIVEINYSALPAGVNHIYSYEAKWILDRPENPLDMFHCPADLTDELEMAISDTARSAFNVLGVRDWCRIDVRLDSKGVPSVIELNPLPGVLPDPTQNSCFPKAARAAGLDFNALINSVSDAAIERYGL